MTKEVTRHNEFFDKAFSHIPTVIDFFKAYLPKAVQNKLDFHTLTLEKANSVLVPEWLGRAHIADLVYRVKCENQWGCILVHTEHQSKPDKLLPLRMLQYDSALLLEAARKHPKKPLPPIISLVYYHGKVSPYPYSLDIHDCFGEMSPELKAHMLKPILIDVTKKSDNDLLSHGQAGPIEYIFKHIFDEDEQEKMRCMFSHLPAAAKDLYYYGIHYIMHRNNTPREKAMEIALQHMDKEIVMTTFEQIRQTGFDEAMREKPHWVTQGIERTALNMLQEGLSLKMIKRITQLSNTTLQKLSQKIEKEIV